MSKVAFDAKLAAIDALRSSGAVGDRDAALRKALGDRNNYFAGRAAHVTGEVLARALIPDLLTATTAASVGQRIFWPESDKSRGLGRSPM